MTSLLNTKLLLISCCYFCPIFAFSQTNAYQPDEVLIKWKSHTRTTQRSNLKTQLQVTKTEQLSNQGIELWQLKKTPSGNLVQLIEQYKDHPNIEIIEPNYKCSTTSIPPNDYHFEDLWGLNNIGQTNGTLDADIDAIEAWGIKKESPNVKIAIIDSGVDWSHPDLVNNIWQNLGEDADGDGRVLEWNGSKWVFDPDDINNIDDDNNGYIDDFVGWDFVDNDNDPSDELQHGTLIAGIIGAEGDNGIGITGVTWDVQMAVLRFIDANNQGDVAHAIQAIEYAVANDMPISNNSWGNLPYSEMLAATIQAAANQNHLFIAAAGNHGQSNELTPNYPSAYSFDNIISVAATDRDDQLTRFSNYGATTVDLAAPGKDIFSSLPNNHYGKRNGTSVAAPFVAGACALLLEMSPTASYLDLKNSILNTVDLLPNLNGKTLSGGRLNLNQVLGGVTSNSCASSDSLALVAFYNATLGSTWTTKWDLSQPMNTWYGITTNSDGCVTEINLRVNFLRGSLPKEIGNLTSLKKLDLYNNSIGGSLPSEVGNLTELEYLNLYFNQLSGSIPSSIDKLTKLEILNLEINDLTGSIPTTIGNLISLQDLRLNNNNLSGSIPLEISNLSNLQQLRLNNNQLTGSIPANIGNLPNLSLLWLHNNQLSGCYPENLSNLCSTTNLNFLGNTGLPSGGSHLFFCLNGTGVCPPCRTTDSLVLVDFYNATDGSNWTNTWNLNLPMDTWFGITLSSTGCVIEINLPQQQLNGNIPENFYTLEQLQVIGLSRNSLLGGTISPSIGNLTDLSMLSFSGGQQTGAIPVEIGNLIKLKYFLISGNRISGVIPSEIGNLINLQELSVQNNQITGAIPIEIGNLTKLEHLGLNGNQLTGNIPTTINQLTNLTWLNFGGNNLTGTIPKEIGGMIALADCSLQSNQLTGSIPREIGNLKNLKTISLNNNQLSGNIPAEIGGLKDLRLVYIFNNQLSGSIPAEISNLSSLEYFFAYNNQLSGCFPEELTNICNIFFNFSDNPNLPNGGDFSAFCTTEFGQCTDPVWPGDFNNDGIANHTDALYWGLACENTSGPIRPAANTAWYPQESPNWSSDVNRINKKHQDGNGDGLINVQDLQVLKDNYGQTHGTPSAPYLTNGVAFRLESIGFDGQSRHLYDLYIEADGTPISLHGFACSFDFGDMVVDGVLLDTTNSSLAPDQILDTFDIIDNKLHIALTRTDKTNKLCDGKIGTLIIIMENLAFSEPMVVQIGNGHQMVANGNLNPIANSTLYDNHPAITLNSNQFYTTASVMHEQCDMMGYAMIQAKGGVTPYNYQWSTGATTSQITNLSAGTYTVTVSDATGTTTIYEANVKGNFLPSYNADGELIDCGTTICTPTLNLINEITTGTKQAATSLTANCIIPTNNNVTFKAGNSITLQPGFTVAAGATFLATIEDCTPNNLNNNNHSRNSKPISTLSNSMSPPEAVSLSVHPNPFSYQTIIEYDLPSASPVQLIVSDMRGRQLKTLVKGIDREAGKHQVTLFADGMEGGVYLVSLRTKNGIKTSKIVLLE